MLLNPKKWIIAGLIMLPVQAMAGTSTASFNTITVGGNTYSSGEPGSLFNEFSVTVGAQTIRVSGWSDTEGQVDPNDPNAVPSNLDPYIARAADFDRNDNGWSIENTDENPTKNCGYSHSADNFACSYTDYDFYLLDFGTQAVQLNQVYSSWSHNSSDTQVSFAALDAGTSTDLTNQTFSSLLASSTGAGSSSFSTSRTSTSFDNDSNRNNYYADVNPQAASSTLWIVSAYNTMFGTVNGATANNDGFKLAGVQFTTVDCCGGGGKPIPEPTTIALLTLAMFGLGANRRRR